MTLYYPAKKILKVGSAWMWIGSEGDAESAKFMEKNRIGLVVDCSRNIPMHFASKIESVRVPVNDDPADNPILLRYLPRVVPRIDRALTAGKSVLVHCRAGMQRSAAVATAYVMWKRRLTADGAKKFVNDIKRETFFPVATFDLALRKWETELRRKGRLTAETYVDEVISARRPPAAAAGRARARAAARPRPRTARTTLRPSGLP